MGTGTLVQNSRDAHGDRHACVGFATHDASPRVLRFISLMIQPVALVTRLAGDADAKTLEELQILIADDHRKMSFRIIQPAELFLCDLSHRVCERTDRQCHQHLICMQTRIMIAKMGNL